jgi:hypothetical protein
LVDQPNNIWRLSTYPSPFPGYLLPLLDPNVFPGTAFSSTFSLCSFRNVRDEASNPQKTTRK